MVKGILRDNWWLFLVLALCLAGAVAFELRPEMEPPTEAMEASGPYESAVVARVSKEERVKREQAVLLKTMAGYEEKYEADPAAQDAPAYLFAVGNLYRQKFQNYGEAIRFYELVVTEHADWEGIYKVYPQLIACYEHNNDMRGLTWVCNVMMEHFPEGSQEYLFAQQKRESL
jgi:hypothetical protein